jgi:hypothetical protein
MFVPPKLVKRLKAAGRDAHGGKVAIDLIDEQGIRVWFYGDVGHEVAC